MPRWLALGVIVVMLMVPLVLRLYAFWWGVTWGTPGWLPRVE